MRYPAELHAPSSRSRRRLSELAYPLHDHFIGVRNGTRICFDRHKVNLGTVFAGKGVGVNPVDERFQLVGFMHLD